MKFFADVHISPRTVGFLKDLGYDVVRVPEVMAGSASDTEIISRAENDGRIVLTQDLDFSALVALSGKRTPSVVSLRLTSAKIEHVNRRLEQVLFSIGDDLRRGAIVTVEDYRVRVRMLPLRKTLVEAD